VQGPGDGGNVPNPKLKYGISNLPKDPDDLVKKGGWKETTDSRRKANSNRRDFLDPETGMRVEFDKAEPGAKGFKGKDHYHVPNSNPTSKLDEYLDISGNPVPRHSTPSHIIPR
jgi:hypothetical protein